MQRTHKRLFDAIRHPKLPVQVAFTLLRACAIPVAQYWMRTSPPASTGVMAENFDDLVMQAALTILDIPTAPTTLSIEIAGENGRFWSKIDGGAC